MDQKATAHPLRPAVLQKGPPIGPTHEFVTAVESRPGPCWRHGCIPVGGRPGSSPSTSEAPNDTTATMLLSLAIAQRALEQWAEL